ncbi:hypothetical protein MKY96_15490 [Paenibacillus sp. FSL R7-0302]|uniref:hypothetical protein n=1 Tax=Paenibacillus sp. FSL R7-0302 TaxID=2921681 RepID=UPI0030FA0805
MREFEEIQRDVSAIVRNIVVTMRKDRELPLEQIEILIGYLKEYKAYSRELDVISKKIAYELFYLFISISSQMENNTGKGEEVMDNYIITRLYMTITSIFNDGLYQ